MLLVFVVLMHHHDDSHFCPHVVGIVAMEFVVLGQCTYFVMVLLRFVLSL